jgi:dTDP-4-amino-4,6-dideoxygalactose transaminase
MFVAAGMDDVLCLPTTASGRRHVWNQYVVRVPDGRRDALRQHLAAARVGTEIYYPLSVHQQECYRHLGYGPGSLPESERAAKETLALPIFPELSAAEQRLVVRETAKFFGVGAATRPKLPLDGRRREAA